MEARGDTECKSFVVLGYGAKANRTISQLVPSAVSSGELELSSFIG